MLTKYYWLVHRQKNISETW